jgi:hypothetical protein
VLVCIAGAALTLAIPDGGLWWVYFLIPQAPVLHARRGKAFDWGFGHIFKAEIKLLIGLSSANYRVSVLSDGYGQALSALHGPRGPRSRRPADAYPQIHHGPVLSAPEPSYRA